jgi:hypothetical protein
MAYAQQTPIGTPDFNLITKTLAGLQPDSALQQYAQLHKNNPYILSLAKSESDRRKSLRTAAQGNPGQMPTVADREIAGMATPVMTGSGGTLQTGYGGPVMTGMASGGLPEDQGIAQIPAPNMQYMADGGIAGYEDDEEGMATGGMGGMFNFAQQSEPVMRMSGGGHIPRYQGNTTDGSVVSSNPMYGIPGMAAVQPRAEFTQQGAPENTPLFQRIMEGLSGSNKERQLAMIEQKIAQGTATPEEVAAYQEAKVKAGDRAAIAAKYPDKDAIRAKDFPGVKPGFEKMSADAGAAAPAPTPSAAPAPQGNLPTGLASIAQAKQAGEELYGTKDLERKIEQNRLQQRTDITNEKEESATKLAAFNKAQGPAMAGYSKLLDSQEKADVSDKEKAGLMALFKGFLGIAAGESPNAATNIAKGSMVGLEDYNSSLKDLKKSAKERDKERAYIENAQRAEGREDFKSQQAFENKANDAARAADNHAIDAVTKITGLKGEGSARVYSEMLQQQGANARTNAQINAPSGIERIVDRMARDPKFAESYKNYASIGPEAKGYEAELQAYLKNPMMLKATNPDLAAQFDAIIKQRMLKPTSTPTGPVRN